MTVSFRRTEYTMDASSAINLYASGYMPEILGSLPVCCNISEYVSYEETKYIRGPADSSVDCSETPIDFGHLVDAGLLRISPNHTEKIAANVIVLANAGVVGMGEKLVAALAIEHDWGVIIDDIKAMKRLSIAVPQIDMITSFHLLKFWAEHLKVPSQDLAAALANIRHGAQFNISARHPMYSWVEEKECQTSAKS